MVGLKPMPRPMSTLLDQAAAAGSWHATHCLLSQLALYYLLVGVGISACMAR